MTWLDAGALQQSRLGFKNIEELCGGRGAFRELAMRRNLDTVTLAMADNLFSRDARVGLQGNLGTVSAGRQENATVNACAPCSDVMLGYGPTYSVTRPGNHARTLNIRTDDSIKYTACKVGRLAAVAAHSVGEQTGSTRRNSFHDLALLAPSANRSAQWTLDRMQSTAQLFALSSSSTGKRRVLHSGLRHTF